DSHRSCISRRKKVALATRRFHHISIDLGASLGVDAPWTHHSEGGSMSARNRSHVMLLLALTTLVGSASEAGAQAFQHLRTLVTPGAPLEGFQMGRALAPFRRRRSHA